MLGDVIHEVTDNKVGWRVLPPDGQGPRMEISYQGTGKLLGVETVETGTYTAVARPNGTFFAETHGISIASDGGIISWTSQGIGTPDGKGVVSYRGAIFFESTSPAFSRIGTVTGVTEFEVREDGPLSGKVWEWK
jgi:hypothetical protein